MGACSQGCASTQAPDVSSIFPSSRDSTRSVNSVYSNDSGGDFRQVYSVEKASSGVGSSVTFARGRHRSTSQDCSVKTFYKAKAKNLGRIQEELSILKMMDHRNIVKLVESFEDKRTIRIVMEPCVGDNLSDHLVEMNKCTERHAAALMWQIFHVVMYLHSKDVCHRDIRPESFCYAANERNEQNTLKLVGLGSARICQKGEFMHSKAGSPQYASPQVHFGKYDHACDLWSCGVLMHLMLGGYLPFVGESEQNVIEKVRKGAVVFPKKDWKNTSEGSQALIRMLLKMKPHERYTAEQALNDGWVICNTLKESNEKSPDVSPCRSAFDL